jgi:hypothetical protein
VFYVAAQIAGALTGAALVLAIWGGWATNVLVGATVPKDGNPLAALAAETAMTFLLVSLGIETGRGARLRVGVPVGQLLGGLAGWLDHLFRTSTEEGSTRSRDLMGRPANFCQSLC